MHIDFASKHWIALIVPNNVCVYAADESAAAMSKQTATARRERKRSQKRLSKAVVSSPSLDEQKQVLAIILGEEPADISTLLDSSRDSAQPAQKITQEMVDIPSMVRSLNPTHFPVLRYLHQPGKFDDDGWLQVPTGRPALTKLAGMTLMPAVVSVTSLTCLSLYSML